MDQEGFFRWLMDQDGKKYDAPGAILGGLDLISWIAAPMDTSKLYCSELAAGALVQSGAIDPINYSEVTPIDLCRLDIYAPEYYQIKGDAKEIVGVNSIHPREVKQ